jgi:site-specific DNA recombinase
MRYAIWTAVSTARQAAEDKVSLQEQEAKCRQLALAHGWLETAGPYIVPGESRTAYINLRDAEAAIPPLADMLDSAKRGEFDILVLYDFTRLRELLDPVARALASYRVQLYSLAQPVEPLPPDQFDAYSTDTASIIQTVSGITSRAEINALRRRFRLGMPARVLKKQLHPLGPLPYGYRKPPGREFDRSAVPIPDPEIAPAILRAKELFLAGQSLPQIAAELDRMGIPPRRSGKCWHPDTLRYILTNPFYAGQVYFGKRRRQRDPRSGNSHVIFSEPSKIVSAEGHHQPLWDAATQRLIQQEFKRRGKAYAGRRACQLSRLLYCSICGRLLWVGYRAWDNHPPCPDNRVFLCLSKRLDHTRIKETELLPRIADAIAAALRDLDGLTLPQPTAPLDLLQSARVDLLARRDRLTDAYAAGVLPLAEYSQRIEMLDARLLEAVKEINKAENTAQRHQERIQTLGGLAELLDQVPNYIQHADPQEVNARLRAIIEKITVSPTGEFTIAWL